MPDKDEIMALGCGGLIAAAVAAVVVSFAALPYILVVCAIGVVVAAVVWFLKFMGVIGLLLLLL